MSFEMEYWQREQTKVKITACFLTDLDLKLRVGNNPIVKFTMYIEPLLESLSEEKLIKIRKYITSILTKNMRIGVKTIPILDSEGNQIGEMTSESL